MKISASPYNYNGPEKDRGISRMIAVSAVLHGVVIAGILAFSWNSSSHRSELRLPSSYEVTLLKPGRPGGAKSEGPTGAVSSAPAMGTNPTPTRTQQKQPEPPLPELQAKPKPLKPVRAPVKEALPQKSPEPPKVASTPKVEPAVVKQEKVPTTTPQKQVKPEEKEEEPVREPEKQKPEVKTKPPVKKAAAAPPPKNTQEVAKPLGKPLPDRVKPKEQKPAEPKPVVKASQAKPKPQPPVSKPQEKTPEPQKAQPKAQEQAPVLARATSGPKATKAPAAPVATKAATSPAAAQKEAVEKKEENDNAIEEKIAAAVEGIRAREEAAARESSITQALERVRQRVEGREGGEGSARTKENASSQSQREKGDNGGGAKTYGAEFLAYTENIKQRVKDGWLMPERRPGLTAVIQFVVEIDGKVADVEVVKSSGDRAFDQSALRAVRTANLPPPPEAYREEFAAQKVHITFKSEE